MKSFCHVTNGTVDNRAIFPDTGLPQGWPDAANWVSDEAAQIGWSYASGTFTAPPPPAPVPLTPEQQRVVAIIANPRRQALLTAALNTDDAGIISYINAQVTDLPSARTMLANLALIMLAVIRS